MRGKEKTSAVYRWNVGNSIITFIFEDYAHTYSYRKLALLVSVVPYWLDLLEKSSD